MRILMMIHTPWSRDLGAPRVQMELGEELEKLGHTVEKWSYEDAFPETGRRPAGRFGGRFFAYLQSNRSFAARAAAHVRAHGRRFDVIEAHQTDLPWGKERLGFSGLLVARSVGLIPAYHEFERLAAARWPEPPSAKRLVRRLLTYPGERRRLKDVHESFAAADLINVSNSDDLRTVAGPLGFGGKVVHFPFGLQEARRESFRAARASVPERLAARTVAFIGTWNSRKGSRDWPGIVARVLRESPAARFRFLGTGFGEEYVLREFPADLRGAVEVVPRYRSEELPGLLATATAGAFPGYLEGFGFSVLEKLAAGLPTVTYDAPGPRDMMRCLHHPGMVPVGDVPAFAAALAERLSLSPARYAELSEDSLSAAARFSWETIAKDTAATYEAALARLGREAA